MEGIGLLGLPWVEYADFKGPRGGIMGRRGELDLTWAGYADPTLQKQVLKNNMFICLYVHASV